MTTLAEDNRPATLVPAPPHSMARAAFETTLRHWHAVSAVWWFVPIARLHQRMRQTARSIRHESAIRRDWRYTRARLLMLDDHMLEDIGVQRHWLQETTADDLLRAGVGPESLRSLATRTD